MTVVLDLLWHVSAVLLGFALVFLGCLPMAICERLSDRRAASKAVR